MENYKKEYKKVCLSLEASILNRSKRYAKNNKKKLTQLVEEALFAYLKKTRDNI